MGYYTDFKLKIRHGVTPEDFEQVFEQITSYDLYDDGTHYSLNGAKWYDYDKNMREISNRYPSLVFQLDGDGEEQGDVWRIYYQNGKSQDGGPEVVTTYHPFDPEKLG